MTAPLLWATLTASLALSPVKYFQPVQVVGDELFRKARQPQVAVSPTGTVYLAFGMGNDIYVSSSRDGGKTYQTPTKIPGQGILALGMRRGPRIAASNSEVVVTAILGEKGGGQDGDLWSWRSTDEGRQWHSPNRVNQVSGSAREGLHGLAAGPDGKFCSVWLDLRRNRTQVYAAFSTDGATSWKRERLIYESPDDSVCECCQPSVAYGTSGSLFFFWRNKLSGARDMFLLPTRDNGQTLEEPLKVGQGTWALNACPMDGGGIVVGQHDEVSTIWRRHREIFRCSPQSKEISLGHGEQGTIAFGPKGLYLAWLESRHGTLRVLTPNYPNSFPIASSALDPVLAGSLSGKGPVVLTWEEGQAESKRIMAAVLHPYPRKVSPPASVPKK